MPARNRRRRRRGRRTRLPVLSLLAWICIFAVGYATMAPNSTSTGISTTISTTGISTGPGTPLQLCQRPQQDNCVIDGDTLRYGGSTIRLQDIDAPETFQAKCASEAELGRRATRRLLEMVNAEPFEVVYTGGRDTDVYGRKLRRLERDGRSLGAALVAEGLARPWDGGRRPWC